MQTNRATIAHIAERAGVSVGTVSNVLNDKGRFGPETRERVMKAALELNFAPNALIRSLQSGKTHTIGVFTWGVTTDTTRDISMLLLRGAMNGIATAGYDALLYSRHPHIDEVSVSMFLDQRVDGLILSPGGLSAEGLQILANCGLPTVAIYQREVPDGIGTVNIDNAAGVRAAIGYLAALGHRRIAFYAPTYTFDFSDRFRGYCEGLEQNGLPFDLALRIKAKTNYQQSAGEALTYLLALPGPPTAIVAADDSAALAFIEAIQGRGLRTPQDISVVGFDDAPAAIAPPGLTTVRQPAEEVGLLAAQYVKRLIDGESANDCRITLDTEFIIRNTTGPVRKIQ